MKSAMKTCDSTKNEKITRVVFTADKFGIPDKALDLMVLIIVLKFPVHPALISPVHFLLAAGYSRAGLAGGNRG